MKLPTMLACLVMAMALCATVYFTLALKPSSFNAFIVFVSDIKFPLVR